MCMFFGAAPLEGRYIRIYLVLKPTSMCRSRGTCSTCVMYAKIFRVCVSREASKYCKTTSKQRDSVKCGCRTHAGINRDLTPSIVFVVLAGALRERRGQDTLLLLYDEVSKHVPQEGGRECGSRYPWSCAGIYNQYHVTTRSAISGVSRASAATNNGK